MAVFKSDFVILMIAQQILVEILGFARKFFFVILVRSIISGGMIGVLKGVFAIFVVV